MATNEERANLNADDYLLDIKAVSLRLSVSVRTVQRLDSSGKLPRPIRVGGSVRWRKSDIDAWIAEECPTRDVSPRSA